MRELDRESADLAWRQLRCEAVPDPKIEDGRDAIMLLAKLASGQAALRVSGQSVFGHPGRGHIDFTPFNPIQALFWSAKVMGQFPVTGVLCFTGCLATAALIAAGC